MSPTLVLDPSGLILNPPLSSKTSESILCSLDPSVGPGHVLVETDPVVLTHLHGGLARGSDSRCLFLPRPRRFQEPGRRFEGLLGGTHRVRGSPERNQETEGTGLFSLQTETVKTPFPGRSGNWEGSVSLFDEEGFAGSRSRPVLVSSCRRSVVFTWCPLRPPTPKIPHSGSGTTNRPTSVSGVGVGEGRIHRSDNFRGSRAARESSGVELEPKRSLTVG